jgi:hypothetical protein
MNTRPKRTAKTIGDIKITDQLTSHKPAAMKAGEPYVGEKRKAETAKTPNKDVVKEENKDTKKRDQKATDKKISAKNNKAPPQVR